MINGINHAEKSPEHELFSRAGWVARLNSGLENLEAQKLKVVSILARLWLVEMHEMWRLLVLRQEPRR